MSKYNMKTSNFFEVLIIVLFACLSTISGSEICTQSYPYYACHVGRCCKLADLWYCNVRGKIQCDSFAEDAATTPESNLHVTTSYTIPDEPPTGGHNVDRSTKLMVICIILAVILTVLVKVGIIMTCIFNRKKQTNTNLAILSRNVPRNTTTANITSSTASSENIPISYI